MKRETFDSYLSSALGIKRNEDNKIFRLADIDESHYVLTLDYTVKVQCEFVESSKYRTVQ